MFTVGIDLGTSSVKLLLVNEQGQCVKSASRDYPIFYPKPGWSEQNPEDWWNSVISAMHELTEGIYKNEIKAISTAGQMHGLVALDCNNNVIRPAILWNDGRTSKETDFLNNVFNKNGELIKNTGNIAFPGFTLPKILWMKESEPENYGRIAHIMLPKDYITLKLTGKYATDYSDAAGMLLLDVKNKCWSRDMFGLAELNEDVLPGLYESYDKVGNLTAEAAELLGLSEDIIVSAGAGDNAAAAVGTACVNEGDCNISLGTSGTVFLPCKEFRKGCPESVHAFNHATGEFHLMGCILSAASCLKWWAEDVLGVNDLAALQDEISKDNLGRNKVFFLPYLMGERAPHNDPYARGTFFGMTAGTTRADMTQAVLEGVAFALCDIITPMREAGVKITQSTLCGGGAKSDIWKSILANVLDLKLNIPKNEQGPGLGAALLAQVACSMETDVKTASKKTVEFRQTVEQDRELVELYKGRYNVYKSIYPALQNIFEKEN